MEVRELSFLDLDDLYEFLNKEYGEDADSAFNRAIENRDVRFITIGVQETYILLSDVYDFLNEFDGEDGENALQREIMFEEEPEEDDIEIDELLLQTLIEE